MLQILTWLIAVGVAALGLVSLQIGMIAPKEVRETARLIGFVTLVICLTGAVAMVFFAHIQAQEMNSAL